VLARQLEAGTSLDESELGDVVRVDTRDPAAFERVRRRMAGAPVEAAHGTG
jgi:hypothetical protein